jgi:hypothetical protein
VRHRGVTQIANRKLDKFLLRQRRAQMPSPGLRGNVMNHTCIVDDESWSHGRILFVTIAAGRSFAQQPVRPSTGTIKSRLNATV